ncbi:MAG: ABC transporter permease subunit, partial [Myxococcales bacterium]|nr:ABC transporter permease subunit [Myxococcales bacterium]
MLAVVMRVEWRSLRRERSFWLIAMALAAAIGFAALGTRLEIRAEAARAALIAQQAASHHSELAEQAHAIEQGAALRPSTDPTSPLAVGRELARPAQLPLAPLSPLAVGQRDVLPESVMLTTRARTVHASEGETLSPAERASGPFDLSFVLVFLLPLVIIATTFDLLSSER